MTNSSPNKDKLDSVDEAKFILGDEFEEINSLKMCGASIGLFCVFLYPNSSLKIINAITLKFPDIHLSFDFEILS